MQLQELHMLVVLAEELNMRKAAERLFVSQPALSQRLQTIEKAWGTKIFLRSQKGLTVTPAGEKIIQFANDVTSEQDRIRENIDELEGEIHGTLKLAVASIIGQHWLPKVLKTYVEKYPNAKVSLITGWSSEMLKSLYEDQVHIGIIRGNPEWKGRKDYLMTDHLYLVDTEISCIEDIAHTERPFIQFKSDSTYFQEIQHWWHQKFKTSPKQTILVDQIETCKQMALHGIGYAILPSVTLQNEDKVNKMPLLDGKGNPIGRDTWLLGYEPAFELKQVQAFVSVVKEMLDQEHPF
ncbi:MULTISPECIES: transcriptional regulator CcpC [Bacillus]|jgi:DNA-binding transcriptional LysR family regulator|uniref:Transcriptional regulator (Probes citrate or citrate-related metabolite) n=1 Tax=Bacillus mojavensis TaxID=72360 RepID=A0AAP3FVT7_BACMO|nr:MULTISPECIES: transcriptional regulator CcpC [Bacillus]MCC2929656.1 transcriptional regulator CcpC [Bacillus sp. LBG-1-113]MCY8103674.1 transcriptional regulator CcpC [Bacillus mojavensis]MCY8481158.1 transcriptional regulator CcpC [Bacillus mojavensis]MCY8510086.1 transcriptional regulator CcpC [Bacillus mojavensis]MCY9092318.1 transcriptional regulator CcpC [Bacillus mojavensis]